MTKFYYDYEIVEQLLTTNNILTDKDRASLKNMSEEDFNAFHEKFGKEVRNVYSLWNMSNPNTFEFKTEKMIKHPSDVSFDILEKVWQEINKNK